VIAERNLRREQKRPSGGKFLPTKKDADVAPLDIEGY
jgi:hypothetical protein